MARTGWIDRTEAFHLRENGLMLERARTAPAILLRETRIAFLKHLKNVGSSGDIDAILAVERHFLQNDLDRHTNSKGMTDSLTAALLELASAERHARLVRDPAAYRALDQTYSLPKNRLPKGRPDAVPNDEARQFFSSHATRLANQDRSRLDDEEKLLLDQRRANIRAAERLYAVLQRDALEPEPA